MKNVTLADGPIVNIALSRAGLRLALPFLLSAIRKARSVEMPPKPNTSAVCCEQLSGKPELLQRPHSIPDAANAR